MRWVDNMRYVGADRRGGRSGLRLRERRRENGAGTPPSLATALRQLRVRVQDAHEPAGLLGFGRRAMAVALLANTQNNRDVADILLKLVRRLETPRETSRDPRQHIYAELLRAESLLAEER